MRIVYLSLLSFLLFLPGCAKSYRFSVEGGSTVDFFANSPYGIEGSDGIVSLACTDLTKIEGLELEIGAVRWSSPYTSNTLFGANVGYRLESDNGYFIKASIGPFYGDTTVRTSSYWTFGLNLALGMTFNEGKNEFYTGFRHFSNGSDYGIGETPNMSEEFLNCGVSFLF